MCDKAASRETRYDGMFSIWPYQSHLGGTAAMAISQALGSNAATAGISAADHETQDRLVEFLTIADPARGPPRAQVVPERARDGI